ncbi:hypothetical protein GCM10017786_19870 [Amycolatopsis deserti]|uniref:Uncharacterized protein n=1 Tax=Amycolatopsis deserti TaxID=185696 RepID=A0ABQ3IQI5_9PSEU|nr:hypothetical protein [Amycolatopsis deserti]GHE88015.1 hypothetical protein GCM10017786_19870 [Amycolatopsis deserti]
MPSSRIAAGILAETTAVEITEQGVTVEVHDLLRSRERALRDQVQDLVVGRERSRATNSGGDWRKRGDHRPALG